MGSNLAKGVDVSCERCVLSGRNLCVVLFTRPEESTECGVSECEASIMRMPWHSRGSCAMGGGWIKLAQNDSFHRNNSINASYSGRPGFVSEPIATMLLKFCALLPGILKKMQKSKELAFRTLLIIINQSPHNSTLCNLI